MCVGVLPPSSVIEYGHRTFCSTDNTTESAVSPPLFFGALLPLSSYSLTHSETAHQNRLSRRISSVDLSYRHLNDISLFNHGDQYLRLSVSQSQAWIRYLFNHILPHRCEILADEFFFQ
jgi:hypothetical protein